MTQSERRDIAMKKLIDDREQRKASAKERQAAAKRYKPYNQHVQLVVNAQSFDGGCKAYTQKRIVFKEEVCRGAARDATVKCAKIRPSSIIKVDLMGRKPLTDMLIARPLKRRMIYETATAKLAAAAKLVPKAIVPQKARPAHGRKTHKGNKFTASCESSRNEDTGRMNTKKQHRQRFCSRRYAPLGRQEIQVRDENVF